MRDFNPDLYLAQLRQCRHLPESAMKHLCLVVRARLMEESNVQPVQSPVTVCGDIHGQLWDLLELLNVGGPCPDTSYIFMVRSLRHAPSDSTGRLCRPWLLQPRDALPSPHPQGQVRPIALVAPLTLAGIPIASPFCAATTSRVRSLKSTAFTVRALEGRLILITKADECQQKYGNANVWKACCAVFDYLNLAAVRCRWSLAY